MRTLRAEPLQGWSASLLAASGLEADAAETVAGTLVATSLRGVDSHGVARLPIYVERLRAGVLNGTPRPKVDRRDGAVAVVDGDGGPGQIAGLFATDLSVELAGSFGVGAVTVHSSNHYGAAGIYAARAARAGMVGVSTTNADPLAVPFGGARKALGTNPIAFAAPTDGGVFVLDMATSQVAANKVFNARDEGRAIPEGWAVDESGAAITDPDEFYAVVPLGGYKGYGLALMVEVLSGVLGGAAVTHDVAGLFAQPRAPAGPRALPPRAGPGADGRPRALRVRAVGAARRAARDPACSGLRGGAGRRRPRGARRARAKRGRDPAARCARGDARGAERRARRPRSLR